VKRTNFTTHWRKNNDIVKIAASISAGKIKLPIPYRCPGQYNIINPHIIGIPQSHLDNLTGYFVNEKAFTISYSSGKG
jgi:hypothetical protein